MRCITHDEGHGPHGASHATDEASLARNLGNLDRRHLDDGLAAGLHDSLALRPAHGAKQLGEGASARKRLWGCCLPGQSPYLMGRGAARATGRTATTERVATRLQAAVLSCDDLARAVAILSVCCCTADAEI